MKHRLSVCTFSSYHVKDGGIRPRNEPLIVVGGQLNQSVKETGLNNEPLPDCVC